LRTWLAPCTTKRTDSNGLASARTTVMAPSYIVRQSDLGIRYPRVSRSTPGRGQIGQPSGPQA
jgi:hypothetical protein